MTADGQFYIDDKPYELEPGPAKVSLLLQFAGTSAGEAVLISEDGTEHGNPDESMFVSATSRHLKSSSTYPVHSAISSTSATVFPVFCPS